MGGVFYLYWDVYNKKEATNPCVSQDGDSIDINNITSEALNGMWKSYGPAVIVSARFYYYLFRTLTYFDKFAAQ